MDNDDVHFYPFVCCVSCAKTTDKWGWIENPYDEKIYGVCDNCKEDVKLNGLKIFNQ
jgi:hypothetical protein